MRNRLLSLILFYTVFNLLCPLLQSHPQPSSPSNALFSFIPETKHSLRSFRNLLTYCCRDANLISHKHFTLNQVNVLTLPHAQYRILQSLRPQLQLSSFRNLQALPSPLSKNALLHLVRQSSPSSTSGYRDFYTTYHTYEQLQAKWADLARRYSAVQLTEIGLSLEKRPIHLLQIGTTNPDNPKRIFLNGLQHAREWITAAATTFIAEKLAINSAPGAGEGDLELQTLLRSVQVLIVPVVNPDGFVFSHTEAPDISPRLWRKNRRPDPGNCIRRPDQDDDDSYAPGGVDLNRNWAKDFGGPHQTSTDQCHNLYIGTHAFSEPETQALSKLIQGTKGIVAHIDFHSYGQVILGPWASSVETPSRACEYDIVGKEMEIAMIATAGVRYTYGRGPKFKNEFFAASGVMTDWVHDEFSQTLSYTIELRPDNPVLGERGFDLPTKEILPTSNEAFSAVRTLLRYGNDPSPVLTQCTPPGEKPSQGSSSTAPPREEPAQESSSNVGLIAGAVVGVVLAAVILVTCIFVFRIRRRRLREKQIEMNMPLNDDAPKEGGSLESVCAVVKLPQTLLQPGTIEAREPSSNETLNTGQTQFEVLSTLSNDCITPVCPDESPSAWYSMEGGCSYGNTVLLDAQNPFFPGASQSARLSTSGS